MNLRIFALLLAIMPGVSDAAVRSEAARVGMQRAGGAGVRAPTMVKNLKKSDTKSTKTSKTSQPKKAEVVEEEYEEEYSEEYEEEYDDTDVGYSDDEEYVEEEVEEEVEEKPAPKSANCRDAYRECMDEFCLLDESEGYRCACSSNINKSKSLIQEIQKIQEEADKLYTEGVEREQLGAKAR